MVYVSAISIKIGVFFFNSGFHFFKTGWPDIRFLASILPS